MEGLKEFAGWIVAVISIPLVAWFTRRDVSRYDKGLERIAALEQTYVTHEELERILARSSAERAAMHSENRDELHELRDDVQTLLVHVALLAQAQGIELPAARQRRQ